MPLFLLGQTLMALYTVPAGKTAYLLKFGSIDKSNGEAKFRLMAVVVSSSVLLLVLISPMTMSP